MQDGSFLDQIFKMGSTVTILISLLIINAAYGCSSGSNNHVINTNGEDQIPWLALITQYKDERLFFGNIDRYL